MRRAGLAVLVVLAGCRSSLELDSGGRAYECARDGGEAAQCPHGWRCGDDGRCLDPMLGVARRCESAETGCGGGWKCGLEQACFDPKKTDGPARACSDSARHCYDRWRCGLDRICFDPAFAGALDGGPLRCTNAAAHCPDGHRCGLDGLCFNPVRTPDAGAGPECTRDDQCAAGWRCGREAAGRRLCQPLGFGGPYACASDDDCEGWRCNPVELRCVDVREPLRAPPFVLADVRPRLLSPLPQPGEPQLVAATEGVFLNPGLRFDRAVSFSVAGVLTLDAGLLVTMWSYDSPRVVATGELFNVEQRRHLIPSTTIVELGAGGTSIFTLDDAGIVTEYDTGATTGRVVLTNAVALRQSLSGRGELAAIVQNGGARALVGLTGAYGPDAGPLINPTAFGCDDAGAHDLLWSQDSATIRALFVNTSGACFHTGSRFGPSSTSGTYGFEPDGGSIPRRLFANFANSHTAFATAQPTVTSIVIEVERPNVGHRYFAFQLGPWASAGFPNPSPTVNGQFAPACSLCPGGVRPTEVVPKPASDARGGSTDVLVRCPTVTLDAGVFPEGSYLVTARERCEWDLRRIHDEAELRPHEGRVAVATGSQNRRVLAGQDGQLWLAMRPPGDVARPLWLDHAPDLVVRLTADPSAPPILFFQTETRPFRLVPGFGALTLGDQPQAEVRPLATVLDQPRWVITATGVYDIGRSLLGSFEPLQVASAPAGVEWVVPMNAVQVANLLFVGSRDTVYVGDVTAPLASLTAAPATMIPALIPVPGLPIRGLTARLVPPMAWPELWVVAGDGVFRSTTTNGQRWITQRVSLGSREGTSHLSWAEAEGVRVLLENGEVVSLPTSVPLAGPPDVTARIVSSLRACNATWAVVSRDGGAGLYLLDGSPSDGGLASWQPVGGLPSSLDLRSAQLRRTDQDLLVVSRTGELWDLTPALMRDGGCR